MSLWGRETSGLESRTSSVGCEAERKQKMKNEILCHIGYGCDTWYKNDILFTISDMIDGVKAINYTKK